MEDVAFVEWRPDRLWAELQPSGGARGEGVSGNLLGCRTGGAYSIAAPYEWAGACIQASLAEPRAAAGLWPGAGCALFHARPAHPVRNGADAEFSSGARRDPDRKS